MANADHERGRCSSLMTPRGYDHEDYQSPHTKKSVLTKVKEKARKWRNTLSKKKHGHDGASPTATPTPTRRVSLVEEGEEEAPEYHGAPCNNNHLIISMPFSILFLRRIILFSIAVLFMNL